MWVAFANHIFFSKNICIFAIFNDQSFNDSLTNDIVSFEQLGPDFYNLDCVFEMFIYPWYWIDIRVWSAKILPSNCIFQYLNILLLYQINMIQ